MGLLIRTLLIWLMVFAVPAQGAAATTMAFCGPNHHGGAAATHAQQAGLAAHSNHRNDAQSAHAHHGMAAQADADDLASAASAAPSQGSHTAKQKCSACASCCSISALLSPTLAVPALAVTPTVFNAVVPTVDAFAADGPDRPPRIARA